MRPIAFDLARFLVGAASQTPRGIDRVDWGYAEQVFADPDTLNVGLVPSIFRMSTMPAAGSRAIMGIVDAHWRETRPSDGDEAFGRLSRLLRGAAPDAADAPAPAAPADRHAALVLRYLRILRHASASPARAARRAVPEGAIYVNTGQVLLGWPWFFNWLSERPDVRCVIMMHDLIPLLHPEYSGPMMSRHHGRAAATVARRASAMIATSHASADEIRDWLRGLGRTDMPIHVVPLPIADSLLAARDGPAFAASRPYLISVGIIDQRKNHRLLLHIWREMIQDGVADIPILVIAGSRGLRTSELHDLLRRSPGLSRHVLVVSGLSSPGLREVVRGARAVLMPSFTEGFGLPVVEALALGTPVIASDIPAHREVGGALATYLDPLDGPGWRDAILAHTREDEGAAARRRAALAGYAPQTWASYFAAVMPLLAAL